jgi:hypothetical protein
MIRKTEIKESEGVSQASSTPSQSARIKEDEPLLYKASEEEQRQFASNYGSELVISLGLSKTGADSAALLKELVEFCRSERRIAPLPEFWERFCSLISVGTAETKQLGPLPNTDWIFDSARRERLVSQLNHAYENDSLVAASDYLRSLTLEQWLLDPWAK